MKKNKTEVLRYEVRYEAETFSGLKLILASSPEEALRIFRERWEEVGDTAPTCWISGAMSMD